MQIIYSLAIRSYYFAIAIAALFGNSKAKLWISGRRNWHKILEEKLSGYSGKERFWFHCASLGEFEQGRALIEKVRKEFPDAFILLTFFSPSGYEIRKNYPVVNFVCYLPLDTKRNAKRFVRILNPSKTIFIKYEFWYNYINELSKAGKPLFIASAIFRPQQVFFKWYGTFFRSILKKITHIFLQDKNSMRLLSDLGVNNCSITGDTRFDRVYKIAHDSKPIPAIEQFIGSKHSIVAGSTWPVDEEILLQIFHSLDDNNLKLILVPHEVSEQRILQLKDKIIRQANSKGVALYSDKILNRNSSIMIVDTIGLLSSVYKYATLTWIGGGFNNGIHNSLEAAAHGKPVFFGPEYQKFREAHDLIGIQSAFSVKNPIDGKRLMQKLLFDKSLLEKTGQLSSDYVQKNTGATEKIFFHIFQKSEERKKPGAQQIIEY
ncbi:MAG: 3-deoxy-D-manno-octulosonic acid transferase [Bacteroidetes bacterium]|nr:3-deoxy-D-manno-octulosonic acid transferase [Bacteroidota bacterium]